MLLMMVLLNPYVSFYSLKIIVSLGRLNSFLILPLCLLLLFNVLNVPACLSYPAFSPIWRFNKFYYYLLLL